MSYGNTFNFDPHIEESRGIHHVYMYYFQRKEKIVKKMEDITELPEEFRPPEWLTDVIPRKSPYVPQMGDDVMYFKQGHELYLLAVKKRNVYKLDIRKSQPWHVNPNLRVLSFLLCVYLPNCEKN